MPSRSLFADRDFRLLLLGQTTSQFGTQLSGVALPLLAVGVLGASAFEIGLINAAATLAFAVIGLPAGAWLDRWPRRPVLVVSDVARSLLLVSIPIGAVLGVLSVGQLVVVSFLVGLARVFFDVGYRSYLPSVVGPDRVLRGNASLELVRASGQVLGPGLGGLLVGLAGAAGVVAVPAATFAVSAVTLARIRTGESRTAPAGPRTSLGGQIRDGLRFVWGSPVLRATAVASAVSNLAFAVASAVMILFLARTLLLSPAAIGVVLAIAAAAAMAGAAVTPRAARRVGSARIVWLGLALTTPLALAAPLAQPGLGVGLLVIGMAAGELGQISYAITSLSLRQQVCPAHLLGRVNATMTVVTMSLFPLGALTGGVLGELIGPRGTLFVSSALLAVAPAVLFRALRRTRDVETLSAG